MATLGILLSEIKKASPRWQPGENLRRLVLTASQRVEIERGLRAWLAGRTVEADTTLGAAFFLYGSRVFRIETQHGYDTIGHRLGVHGLGGLVGPRYDAIETGVRHWFGLNVIRDARGKRRFVSSMLVHSGGGWHYVAEALRELQGELSFHRAMSYAEVEAVVNVLLQRAQSEQARRRLGDGDVREFLVGSLVRITELCSRLPAAERTPERLGEELEIALPDARKAIAEVIGLPRPMPSLIAGRLALVYRGEAGEMPRLVVSAPAALQWPRDIAAERLRIWLEGETRRRPIVYARRGGLAQQVAATDYLDLPDDVAFPLKVLAETPDGQFTVLDQLTFPGEVAVFSTAHGGLLPAIPRSGELALATAPGVRLEGDWGREFNSRSGVAVRLGEVPSERTQLVLLRALHADATDEDRETAWWLEPARPMPAVTLEGLLEGLSFQAGRGRVAVGKLRAACIRAAGGSVDVRVEAPDRRTFVTRVREGQMLELEGFFQPGIYSVRVGSEQRPQSVCYLPDARFEFTTQGDDLLLSARWSSQVPAKIAVRALEGVGHLQVSLAQPLETDVRITGAPFERLPALSWSVHGYPRRVEVLGAREGQPIEKPVFDLIRYEGGLRIYGAPSESVVLRPGFYLPRSLTLDRHGQAFFPFCLLDESEVEDVGLGRDQLHFNVAWTRSSHSQRVRLERERARVLDARTYSTDLGAFVVELERPPFACDPEIELIPVWKPWAGWQTLPSRDVAGAHASAWLRAEANVEPGRYLCAAVDVLPNGHRRLRCQPRLLSHSGSPMNAPEDPLEAMLWGGGLAANPVALLGAFEQRLSSEGDAWLEPLLRAFERYGAGGFALESVLWSSLGRRRLLAHANHARDSATSCDLLLLSICEHERVPWAAVRIADLQAWMSDIETWSPADYALAIDAVASVRAGLIVAFQQAAPPQRLIGFSAALQRIAVCQSSPTKLTREERNLVMSGPQELDETRHGVRIVGLHQLHRRLAGGGIQMDRLRSFSCADVTEREITDSAARTLDGRLCSLAAQVVIERRGAGLSSQTLDAARYAERKLPVLFEYWLERGQVQSQDGSRA